MNLKVSKKKCFLFRRMNSINFCFLRILHYDNLSSQNRTNIAYVLTSNKNILIFLMELLVFLISFRGARKGRQGRWGKETAFRINV